MLSGPKNHVDQIIVLSLFIAFVVLIPGCAEEAAPSPKPEEPGSNKIPVNGHIILATTTSTYDSGLLDYLNPHFTEKTGIEVQVVSQGTGAALESGKRGDADVLLVHDRETELKLVEEGYFVNRYDLMYNDFVIVGPDTDPAGLRDVNAALEAFSLLAERAQTFISRGDDSGTNRTEMRLWEEIGINPSGEDWYLSIGQGMSDTLRVADEMMAYTLTDRATFVSMLEALELDIVLEGDPALYNQYGLMAVNQDKHPYVKYEYALLYMEYLMSEEGQQLIGSYLVDDEAVFFPGYELD